MENSVQYVEPPSAARTKLAEFFNILLGRRQEGPGPLTSHPLHRHEVVGWTEVGHQLRVDPAVIDVHQPRLSNAWRFKPLPPGTVRLHFVPSRGNMTQLALQYSLYLD